MAKKRPSLISTLADIMETEFQRQRIGGAYEDIKTRMRMQFRLPELRAICLIAAKSLVDNPAVVKITKRRLRVSPRVSRGAINPVHRVVGD